ncbi:hypothetical protein G6F43_007238 [Rhizopus delemar]|nr:hypothetical protein G6F43_007238 [Rhizopus delemar]
MLIQSSHSALVEDEDLILPLKWEPGEDLMGKILLSHPKIIDLVVHSLVDSMQAYTLYVSREAYNDKFIPVLADLHEEANHATMLETIDCCATVFAEFRLLPTVLIISINGSSSLEDKNEFNAVDNLFLVQCKSEF